MASPTEAERLYKQALPLASKRNRIGILRALERLYRDRNDPGLAADMKEEADAIEKERQKEGGGGRLFFSSRLGLFVSGVATKEQFEALENALPMEKTLGNRVGMATSYTLLGLHYGLRADIVEDRRAEFEAKAEAMLKDSLAVNKGLGREDAMAFAYHELAQSSTGAALSTRSRQRSRTPWRCTGSWGMRRAWLGSTRRWATAGTNAATRLKPAPTGAKVRWLTPMIKGSWTR